MYNNTVKKKRKNKTASDADYVSNQDLLDALIGYKQKKEDAEKKKLNTTMKKKCGAPKLTRRYFECVERLDKSGFGAAAQTTLTCRDTYCKKEIAAIRKYLKQ